MRQGFGGIVLSTAFRLLVPFSIVYGVYILCFGEYSPGGGFQAGALLAVGVLLSRMILGEDAKFNIQGKTSVVLAGVGTFIYTLVGWVTIFGGGKFLAEISNRDLHKILQSCIDSNWNEVSYLD